MGIRGYIRSYFGSSGDYRFVHTPFVSHRKLQKSEVGWIVSLSSISLFSCFFSSCSVFHASSFPNFPSCLRFFCFSLFFLHYLRFNFSSFISFFSSCLCLLLSLCFKYLRFYSSSLHFFSLLALCFLLFCPHFLHFYALFFFFFSFVFVFPPLSTFLSPVSLFSLFFFPSVSFSSLFIC